MKKKVLLIIIPIVVVLISITAFLGYKFLFNKEQKPPINPKEKETVVEEEPEVQIVDLNSKTRPYAVMINNLYDARRVQSGMSQAYMVYELLAEGGITRFLALFRDAEVSRIGSVRSARHYYIDYVLENDAIFVHWGWSPQAQSDIRSLGIQNIHGLTYEGKYFYRDNPLNIAYEHTGFTNTELLDKARQDLKYPKDTDDGLLLNYSARELKLDDYGEPEQANDIRIFYSNYNEVKYVYDQDMKLYKRFVNNEEHVDYNTKEQLTAKNIIVYALKYESIAGDTKGRQELYNIGEGDGYYISEGKAIKITWKKSQRDAKTKYYFENGKELIVNDGNTYIQIMPLSGELEFS